MTERKLIHGGRGGKEESRKVLKAWMMGKKDHPNPPSKKKRERETERERERESERER